MLSCELNPIRAVVSFKTAALSLESHFAPFRTHLIGINQDFEPPFGRRVEE